MRKEVWHFMVWKQFNKKVFKRTLTPVDQIGKKFYLVEAKRVDKENMVTPIDIDAKVFKFEKDGQTYIVREDDAKNLPIKPTDYLECYIKESDKTIIRLVTNYESARLIPDKTMSFKEFCDGWNPMDHTHPRTKIFLTLQTIASKHKPIKYRLCGQPASMKNANFTLLRYITNDVVRLSKPTHAKLEHILAFNRVLVIDEVTSLSPADVRVIEPTFLNIADESPELEKHSMAKNSKLQHMHLEQTSVIFPYNRVQDLSSGATFFDDVWQSKKAFVDRYPAVLIQGKVTNRMKKLNVQQAQKIMEENYEGMRLWAKNALWYIENLTSILHDWPEDQMKKPAFMGPRQYTNFEGVLDCINAYSETVEEYNDWINWLNERIIAYRKMINPQDEGTLKHFVTEETV